MRINAKKTINIDPESIYRTKVRKFGNGADIPGRKKDLGKDVIVLVKSKDDSDWDEWKEYSKKYD